jgi:hypothetical protein
VQCNISFLRAFVRFHSHTHQTEIVLQYLGLKPTLVSRMKFEDRAVIAWRRVEYFFKCNILGFPRRTVKKSIEQAEKARLQGKTPEMPHGAFELLRIRNRWAQARLFRTLLRILTLGIRFSEVNPEGGYRDVNIKLKIGFRLVSLPDTLELHNSVTPTSGTVSPPATQCSCLSRIGSCPE